MNQYQLAETEMKNFQSSSSSLCGTDDELSFDSEDILEAEGDAMSDLGQSKLASVPVLRESYIDTASDEIERFMRENGVTRMEAKYYLDKAQSDYSAASEMYKSTSIGSLKLDPLSAAQYVAADSTIWKSSASAGSVAREWGPTRTAFRKGAQISYPSRSSFTQKVTRKLQSIGLGSLSRFSLRRQWSGRFSSPLLEGKSRGGSGPVDRAAGQGGQPEYRGHSAHETGPAGSHNYGTYGAAGAPGFSGEGGGRGGSQATHRPYNGASPYVSPLRSQAASRAAEDGLEAGGAGDGTQGNAAAGSAPIAIGTSDSAISPHSVLDAWQGKASGGSGGKDRGHGHHSHHHHHHHHHHSRSHGDRGTVSSPDGAPSRLLQPPTATAHGGAASAGTAPLSVSPESYQSADSPWLDLDSLQGGAGGSWSDRGGGGGLRVKRRNRG